ncbi:MAG: hypothetical protein DCF25_15015 [Leptolyngbya foveolarum]|uniref:Uncharacterized protein n=1 Tax=Leptolyngbya foveolarum TaxID=47253 RepID=A0A2W4U5R4_9CYAN|nr:MAG: hypothetical protein DCF25_15015 [Leptolyngbya foveolarum]
MLRARRKQPTRQPQRRHRLQRLVIIDIANGNLQGVGTFQDPDGNLISDVEDIDIELIGDLFISSGSNFSASSNNNRPEFASAPLAPADTACKAVIAPSQISATHFCITVGQRNFE